MKLNIGVFILLVSILLMMGCKKGEPNNPNVTHHVLNQEMKIGSAIGSSEMSIDINGDGMYDFEIDMDLFKRSNGFYERHIEIDDEVTGNGVIADSFFVDPYTRKVVREQSKGALISGGSSVWLPYVTLAADEPDALGGHYISGFAGKGDIFIAIRFMIGTKLHYGWLKFFISADYKQIIVREVAYDVRPEVEILAGDK